MQARQAGRSNAPVVWQKNITREVVRPNHEPKGNDIKSNTAIDRCQKEFIRQRELHKVSFVVSSLSSRKFKWS